MHQDATAREERRGETLRELHVEVVRGPGEGLAHSSTEPITVGSAEGNDLRLEDRRVSRFHLQLERRADRIRVTDLGSTNGTDIGSARFTDGVVDVVAGTEVRLGRSALVVSDGQNVTAQPPAHRSWPGLRGVSRAMARIFGELEALAATDASVLVVGESGTGKELIARALHEGGPRAKGPFVTVDCGALSQRLAESTFFGHERGAFTGADRLHRGAFERANGGTLFLDEIGELAADLQTRLLGVLERRRFTRVGGEREVAVDVRVVSATHRDLRAAVNSGQFRLDLYYRLVVVSLALPPLRERPEDIPDLVQHLLEQEGHAGPLEDVFPPDVIRELQRRPWPGNVRELRNIVTSALVTGSIASPREIGAEPGPVALPLEAPASAEPQTFRAAKAQVVSEFERRFLRDLMQRADGNVRLASRLAKMHRGYLAELLTRHGLRETDG